MVIYSQSRLVPHNQSYPVTPNKPISSQSATVSGNPGPKRHELVLTSRLAGNINQLKDQDSVYNSTRRGKVSKLDRVGLLIDIYA
jgi:hypothetical protein